MTVVSLQQARLQRANQGAGKQSGQESRCVERSHSSITDFEASRKRDDLSCEAGALEGYLAGEALKFLHDCNRVGTQTASGYMRLWLTAMSLADVFINQGHKLLHHFSLPSTPVTLAVEDITCDTKEGAKDWPQKRGE
jgi:hypothetical protein